MPPLQGNAQGTKSQEYQGTKGLLVAGTASYPRTDGGGYRVPPLPLPEAFLLYRLWPDLLLQEIIRGYLRAGLAADIPLRYIMIHTGPIPEAPGKNLPTNCCVLSNLIMICSSASCMIWMALFTS